MMPCTQEYTEILAQLWDIVKEDLAGQRGDEEQDMEQMVPLENSLGLVVAFINGRVLSPAGAATA